MRRNCGRTTKIIAAANNNANTIVVKETMTPLACTSAITSARMHQASGVIVTRLHECDNECENAPGGNIVDSRTSDRDRPELSLRQAAVFKNSGEHRKGGDAHRDPDE